MVSFTLVLILILVIVIFIHLKKRVNFVLFVKMAERKERINLLVKHKVSLIFRLENQEIL